MQNKIKVFKIHFMQFYMYVISGVEIFPHFFQMLPLYVLHISYDSNCRLGSCSPPMENPSHSPLTEWISYPVFIQTHRRTFVDLTGMTGLRSLMDPAPSATVALIMVIITMVTVTILVHPSPAPSPAPAPSRSSSAHSNTIQEMDSWL